MADKASLRRLKSELKDLMNNPSKTFLLAPLDRNMYEWHVTFFGPSNTPFETGKYHAKILVPREYPFAPPDFIILTPNGRFETDMKICLSISNSFHPEHWNPSLGLRQMVDALRILFSEDIPGVGSIKADATLRKNLAEKSLVWKCRVCDICNDDILSGDNPKDDFTDHVVKSPVSIPSTPKPTLASIPALVPATPITPLTPSTPTPTPTPISAPESISSPHSLSSTELISTHTPRSTPILVETPRPILLSSEKGNSDDNESTISVSESNSNLSDIQENSEPHLNSPSDVVDLPPDLDSPLLDSPIIDTLTQPHLEPELNPQLNVQTSSPSHSDIASKSDTKQSPSDAQSRFDILSMLKSKLNDENIQHTQNVQTNHNIQSLHSSLLNNNIPEFHVDDGVSDDNMREGEGEIEKENHVVYNKTSTTSTSTTPTPIPFSTPTVVSTSTPTPTPTLTTPTPIKPKPSTTTTTTSHVGVGVGVGRRRIQDSFLSSLYSHTLLLREREKEREKQAQQSINTNTTTTNTTTTNTTTTNTNTNNTNTNNTDTNTNTNSVDSLFNQKLALSDTLLTVINQIDTNFISTSTSTSTSTLKPIDKTKLESLKAKVEATRTALSNKHRSGLLEQKMLEKMNLASKQEEDDIWSKIDHIMHDSKKNRGKFFLQYKKQLLPYLLPRLSLHTRVQFLHTLILHGDARPHEQRQLIVALLRLITRLPKAAWISKEFEQVLVQTYLEQESHNHSVNEGSMDSLPLTMFSFPNEPITDLQAFAIINAVRQNTIYNNSTMRLIRMDADLFEELGNHVSEKEYVMSYCSRVKALDDVRIDDISTVTSITSNLTPEPNTRAHNALSKILHKSGQSLEVNNHIEQGGNDDVGGGVGVGVGIGVGVGGAEQEAQLRGWIFRENLLFKLCIIILVCLALLLSHRLGIFKDI